MLAIISSKPCTVVQPVGGVVFDDGIGNPACQPASLPQREAEAEAAARAASGVDTTAQAPEQTAGEPCGEGKDSCHPAQTAWADDRGTGFTPVRLRCPTALHLVALNSLLSERGWK